MKYIDIHCHLDFKDYDADRAEILARMKEAKVGAITIGTDLESSKRAVEIAEANENIWACVGVHPEEVSKGIFDTSELENLIQSPKVVGIGECGLDYFRLKEESEKEIQKNLFKQQIEFALKYDKPLMLHCRDAYRETLDILESNKKEAGDKLRGNVHFFAGDIEIAKRFLDIGFTMSFTGVITFTQDYDEVIRFIPIDSIMLETDAPFVAPVPYRGKSNEPSYVIEVVKRMAELKNVSINEMSAEIIRTANRVFGLKIEN